MRDFLLTTVLFIGASWVALARGVEPAQDDRDTLISSAVEGTNNSGQSVINVVPAGTQIFAVSYDWGGNQLTFGSDGYHQVGIRADKSGVKVGGTALVKDEEYVILVENIVKTTPKVFLYEANGTKVAELTVQALAAKPALINGFSVVVHSNNNTDALLYVLENKNAQNQSGVKMTVTW